LATLLIDSIIQTLYSCDIRDKFSGKKRKLSQGRASSDTYSIYLVYGPIEEGSSC
jgi:hypothetical protein